jgi:GTPase SAR1 family protein
MVKEIIIAEAISRGIDIIQGIFSNKNIKLTVSKDDLIESMNVHSKFILNTTSNISFKELKGNKKLNETYIDLDIELQAFKYKEKDSRNDKFKICEIINESEYHLVILGGPGAGKTTTVKKICQSLLLEETIKNYSFPILINLRELSNEQTIYHKLKDILGIQIFEKNKGDNKNTLIDDKELRIKYINSYLESLNTIIILDGLDEVSPIKLKSLSAEIKTLMTNLRKSLVLVTCRSASYDLDIDCSLEYELCNLNKSQIKDFVKQWFCNRETSKKFLNEIKKSKFYDFSLKPISLAHLCAIYERTKKFYDKPKSIYKKLVRLLIEEWDEQRDITRESNYSNFDNDRKIDFLSHLAYDLTIRFEKKIYFEEDLKDSFFNLNEYYDLPKNQCLKVIKEIEAHTGILIQSSYETFEFVHKSMQEYLCAEHIVKMPEIPVKLLYNVNISNELAITVALSSDPNSYFFKLIYDILNNKKFSKHFIIEFLSRLAYEKPDFRESILIPYTFAYIIREKFDFDAEDNEKLNKIIQQFKEINNVKTSFKKFSFYINSSTENIEDYDDEDIYLEAEDDEDDERSEMLEKFDEKIEYESSADEIEIKKYTNIELESNYFDKLNSNENSYINSLNELKIPEPIFNKHFK